MRELKVNKGKGHGWVTQQHPDYTSCRCVGWRSMSQTLQDTVMLGTQEMSPFGVEMAIHSKIPSPEKISLPCPPQWSKTSGASPTTGRSWHVLAEVTGSRNSNIFPSPAHGREKWLHTMQPSSPCRAVSTLSATPPCLSASNVVNLTPPSDLAAASLLVVGYCFFLSFTSQLKWCHSLPSSHWSPISRTSLPPPSPSALPLLSVLLLFFKFDWVNRLLLWLVLLLSPNLFTYPESGRIPSTKKLVN